MTKVTNPVEAIESLLSSVEQLAIVVRDMQVRLNRLEMDYRMSTPLPRVKPRKDEWAD